MFTAAWQQQTRFAQWQGATLPEPLCGLNATPQGYPMAPVVLCTWILAGTQDVDESLRSLRPRPCQDALQACYMDDRSVVSGAWRQTEEWITCWHEWSRIVGLRENVAETQVTAKTKPPHGSASRMQVGLAEA